MPPLKELLHFFFAMMQRKKRRKIRRGRAPPPQRYRGRDKMVASRIKGDHCTRHCHNQTRKIDMKAKVPSSANLAVNYFFLILRRGRVNTHEQRMGFVLQTFYIIFFGLIVPYNTLCYHEMTRPVSRIYERPPFRGSDLIQTDSPGTPPTYRFIIKLSLSLYICLQISGRPHSPDIRRRRVGSSPPSDFCR